MTTLLGFLMLFSAFVVVGVIISQARRGVVDLFSVRNFFLLGFIIFQLTSASITLWTGYYDALLCNDYASTGLIYSVVCLSWLMLFFFFYKHNKPADWFATKLRSSRGETTPIPMLILASSFLFAAIICRFVIAEIPVVGVLALIVTTGLAGAAAGTAAWVWAPRPLNMAVAIIAAGIIFIALGLTLYQNFGRRDALSVVVACVWGAHHGYWKHIGLRRALKQLVPLGLAGLVFMAGLSAGRREEDRKLGFVESITRVAGGKVGEGILAMASGQAAAACSMWVIESRPQSYKFDTFHTFRYFVGHPVPRIIWPEKPLALGWMMTDQGNVRGRSKGFNFGPGLVGHIWNDNPYLSLIPYAFGMAFLLKFMDRLTALNPSNPFIIIPLGCALGDVLGIPRGEAGLFLARATLMMVSAFMGMSFCALVLGTVGLHLPQVDPASTQAPEPYETNEYSDSDAEHPPESSLIDPELAANYAQEPTT